MNISKKGKLYGIGTGPGDPKLITLKALETIKNCQVIAVPKTGAGDKAAFDIVEKYLEDKQILECFFSMDKDLATREKTREESAKAIKKCLDEGQNVGFITLGDPTLYSTYIYIHKIIEKNGYETEIIPGVTSFSAVAAKLNTPLCEGEEMLTIIPASLCEDIESILNLPGNKIIMKSGKNISNVIDAIKKRNMSNKTMIVERCGMEGEKIYKNLDDYVDSGYFSTILIKEKE